MTCEDRDPDLLLFGLGELPARQHRQVARHLRTCARCRARQKELAAVSVQIAEALRPPAAGSGGPRGSGTAAPIRPGLHALSPLILILTLGFVLMSLFGVWYVRSHAPAHPGGTDEACRPDLRSDKCR